MSEYFFFFLNHVLYFTKICDVDVADARQRNPKRSSLTSFPGSDKSNKHQFYVRILSYDRLPVKLIFISPVKSLYFKTLNLLKWSVCIFLTTVVIINLPGNVGR